MMGLYISTPIELGYKSPLASNLGLETTELHEPGNLFASAALLLTSCTATRKRTILPNAHRDERDTTMTLALYARGSCVFATGAAFALLLLPSVVGSLLNECYVLRIEILAHNLRPTTPSHRSTTQRSLFRILPIVLHYNSAMTKMTKVSRLYWEATCRPPTKIPPSQISDTPRSTVQTLSLTGDDLERVKKLLDPAPAPLPEPIPNKEYTARLVHPLSWKLTYSKEAEAQIQGQEKPAPESLPHPLALHQADVPRNTIGTPRLDPIFARQPARRPQGTPIKNRVRSKLSSAVKDDEALNPHGKSDVIWRETRIQLDVVDRAHDKLKKSYVDFEHAIKSAEDKKK
ncbi:unnamed protein product [Fusarium graminearum]|nr:unnamed protein product [Fusarium graminearum]CAF3504721.1 unnamed protein product [Fusarium graminearum]CAF3561014.1 unnamed protein product [Fusarium graminearum]CAG1970126.1 unnamed protein product [Fusarium graminearum]CAG1978780.1 unnamed protein product [Fusarium graminearum]